MPRPIRLALLAPALLAAAACDLGDTAEIRARAQERAQVPGARTVDAAAFVPAVAVPADSGRCDPVSDVERQAAKERGTRVVAFLQGDSAGPTRRVLLELDGAGQVLRMEENRSAGDEVTQLVLDFDEGAGSVRNAGMAGVTTAEGAPAEMAGLAPLGPPRATIERVRARCVRPGTT